jgi:predicted nucleotidyltransferase
VSTELLLEERKYLRDLVRAPSLEPHAVVLVGSWARGTYRSLISDIDVLVVGESVPLGSPPGGPSSPCKPR